MQALALETKLAARHGANRMRYAAFALPVAMSMVLGACKEAPKSIEYWLANKDELREMSAVCLMNGAANKECENVARASHRMGEQAMQDRINARRAGRGE